MFCVRPHGSAACVGMVVVGVYLSTTEKCHYSSAGLKLLNEMSNEKVQTVYHTGLTLLLSANVPSCGKHPLHVLSSVSSVPSGAILLETLAFVGLPAWHIIDG